MEKTSIKKPKHYSENFKQKVLRVMLTGGIGATEASRLFGVTNESSVRNWIKKYGEVPLSLNRTIKTFALKENPIDETIETSQLKKRIKELEKALEHSELKAEAYSTMIDVAEEELKISIRKKLNTKQLQG